MARTNTAGNNRKKPPDVTDDERRLLAREERGRARGQRALARTRAQEPPRADDTAAADVAAQDAPAAPAADDVYAPPDDYEERIAKVKVFGT